jgi:hypothetical protein
MKRKKTKKTKKVGRPHTTGPGHIVGVRCQKAFLKAVDAWLKQNKVHGLTRAGAIRLLAEVALSHARE